LLYSTAVIARLRSTRLPRRARCLLVAGILFALAPWPARAEATSGLDELLATRVSSASKLEQTSMRAPASVTVVTAEEIERYGYRTLDELLGSVTGFYLSYDRNYAYVGVRGFSRPTDYNTRVLLLIDGHRVNEDVYGQAPIGTDLPIDLRAVERVEIVRGPGSVSFGSSAMLAVVNVVLRAPTAAAGTSAAVELGEHGRAHAALRGAFEADVGAALAWSAAAYSSAGPDLYFAEYDDAETGGGRTRDTDWDRGRSATLRASFRELDVTAFATSREKGVPTGSYDDAFDDRRAATRDDWLLVGLDWSRRLAHGWSLTTRASAGRYGYDGFYPDVELLYLDSTDSTWWTLEAQATWEQRADSRLTAGVELRRATRADFRSFDETGEVYFDGNFPSHVAALYVEQELQLSERVIATLGLRHDDPSFADARTSPRLALVFLPNRANALKLLYGRAFRAPTVYEREYEDAPSGVGANPDVEAESIESVEAVWERRFSDVLFGSVSVYRYQMFDLIEQRVDGESGLLVFGNVGSATSRGIEVGATARLRSGFSGYARASWQRTRDDRGELLSNSPAGQAKLGVSLQLGAGWRASTALLWESGRRTVQGTTTDSFLRADAVARWQRAASPWALELQLRNLADARYAYPGGLEHRQAAIEQDGRTLTLRVEYRF
jgi:iron complex outermembrane receptor protein